MSFRLLGLAAVAAATTLASVAPAAAGCWSCGCAPSYAYVQTRVVYVQSPCAAWYRPRPVYVVNQGPTFTEPVPPAAMPSPYIRHRALPYPYGAGYRHHGYRHHRYAGRHFHRARHHGYGPRVLRVPRYMKPRYYDPGLK